MIQESSVFAQTEKTIVLVFISAFYETMVITGFLWMTGCLVRLLSLSYVPAERMFLVVDDTQTFLFARSEHHADDTYINFFSVLSRSAHSTIKNRVVVENTGNDEGFGEWKCHKDSRTTECVHIVDARHALQRYLHGDPNATDPNAGNGSPRSSAVSIPVISANVQ